MKRLTDVLSGIKNIFCRQQNSAHAAGAGCVEFTNAAERTRGSGGTYLESWPVPTFQPKDDGEY